RADEISPTRANAYRTIGNSMSSPKTRNIVVTKSKYGGAASVATRVSSVNARRNWIANGRMTQATVTPSTKKNSASGIHGRSGRFFAGVQPGGTNCQSRAG